ncbi:MAG TPA: response regulator [Chromatiales bacterium]|nr:response regulator [Chromatiales bacterium]
MTVPKVMVVDDDAEIRDLLRAYLQRNGLAVVTVGDGAQMWRALSESRPDLVILDIMLPGDDGLSLCRDLRARPETADLPVIMLTARGEDMDRILGLEMGADDYLPKPFNPRELLARIKVVLRRAARGGGPVGSQAPPPPGRLHFAGWTLDLTARHLVDAQGVVVPLSGGEYRLLRVFLDHPNRVLNRDQILDALHGREWMPFDRSIDVQISRLRKRLRDDSKNPSIIKTVRGEGYVLAAKVVQEP